MMYKDSLLFLAHENFFGFVDLGTDKSTASSVWMIHQKKLTMHFSDSLWIHSMMG